MKKRQKKKPPTEHGKLGRKAHKPTPQTRERIKSMSAIGIPQKDIALVMQIDSKTLQKYYRHELDTAATIANAMVGGALYNKCMKGDTASIIFWCKTRLGMKETSVNQFQNPDGSPIDFTGKVTVEFVDADPASSET